MAGPAQTADGSVCSLASPLTAHRRYRLRSEVSRSHTGNRSFEDQTLNGFSRARGFASRCCRCYQVESLGFHAAPRGKRPAHCGVAESGAPIGVESFDGAHQRGRLQEALCPPNSAERAHLAETWSHRITALFDFSSSARSRAASEWRYSYIHTIAPLSMSVITTSPRMVTRGVVIYAGSNLASIKSAVLTPSELADWLGYVSARSFGIVVGSVTIITPVHALPSAICCRATAVLLISIVFALIRHDQRHFWQTPSIRSRSCQPSCSHRSLIFVVFLYRDHSRMAQFSHSNRSCTCQRVSLDSWLSDVNVGCLSDMAVHRCRCTSAGNFWTRSGAGSRERKGGEGLAVGWGCGCGCGQIQSRSFRPAPRQVGRAAVWLCCGSGFQPTSAESACDRQDPAEA